MNYTKISDMQIKDWLKKNLSEERYSHTLGTAQCAKELAEQFGFDSEKAYLSGLLHDCAKCFDNDKLLQIINENLNVEKCELMNYKTLHAPVSAFIAEKKFGITDKEILSAIRWHTLGKIDMTDFEKLIFLADKIEPNTRDKTYSEKIRSIINEEHGFNHAMLECYKSTIKSLVERNLKICLLTIDIYNELQDIIKL